MYARIFIFSCPHGWHRRRGHAIFTALATIGSWIGVGTATNFRTAVYHGTEVRTAIRTAIYRVTCNFGRDHQFAPKYKGHVRYSYLFCTIDDSFADLNLSDYLDTVFYTSPKMCKWCVMTINIVFRSFTEITERTGAGTSVPRYVSPDHCTVVYRYTGYTAHPYSWRTSGNRKDETVTTPKSLVSQHRCTSGIVAECIPCQASGTAPKPEPLRMSELPTGPWLEVCADFFGPLPTGVYILVVIDEYSKYPEIDIIHSTSATAVIPKMD